MFHPSILELESQIQYHQEQCQLAEQELDRLKMTQAFAEDAAEKVEDALEHIDPKYVDVFREHLLALFPTEAPVYLEEKVEEVIESQEVKKEKEFGPISYYELTGRPDVRPDAYEELAPNITYSSSSRAYVGFHDRQQAEEFRDSITEPCMLSDTETMNGHKYEVKFYCTREYIEELLTQLHNDDFEQDEDWTPEQRKELDWQEQLVRIAPDIFYDPSTSKCYLGFSNYQRANTYGAHLKEIHELYDSRYTVDKPTVVTNCKHELVIECITEDDSRKLAPLNLKKELEHKSNKAITDTWLLPLKKEDIEEGEYPAPPYNKIPLDQVEICDVVTTSPNSQSAYEVTGNKGTHLLATCLYNKSLPHREGQKDFWIKEAYLVQKASISASTSYVSSDERGADDVPLAS